MSASGTTDSRRVRASMSAPFHRRFEDAAVKLAADGYEVFRLQPRTKIPATPNGFKDATRDERAVLHAWDDRRHDCNIGIACGATGIVVWDIDAKAGADPRELLDAYDVGAAPIVWTGEAPDRDKHNPNSLPGVRGAQVYFRGSMPTTNRLSERGTEIRGQGAYVVAPPSVHPSGVEYSGTLPPVHRLPLVPDWLRAMVDRSPRQVAKPVDDTIPKGEQHTTLVGLAGSMRRRGMGADEIEAALLVTNEKRLEDPAPRENIRKIAESVAAYPPGSPNRSFGTNGGQAADGTLYELSFDDKNKLKLPELPAPDDVAGACRWLTVVFQLDAAHPIVAGTHEGLRGPTGHGVLNRRGAPPFRFEPASRVNTPGRLFEDLDWQKQPSDGIAPSFKAEHCRHIAHVIRMLCGASRAMTDEQETAGVISVFLQAAEPVEGLTTYGTSAQRYEAATALQRPLDAVTGRPTGALRYLVDANTGELVIRVQDLGESVRRQVGSSLARGWLDARMQNLGWARVRLDGHARPGRERVGNPHARTHVYRGLLTHDAPGTDDVAGEGEERLP